VLSLAALHTTEIERPALQPAFLFGRFLRQTRSSRVQETKLMEPAKARNLTPSAFVVGAGNAKHVRRNSMTNRFLISVAAAALIAGTGFANAQGTGMSREGGSSAGSTVQSAPSSGPSSAGSAAGQMSHESTESKSPEASKPSSGMKATQSEQKSPSAAKSERVEDMQKSKGMSSENNAKGGAKDMKAEGREDRSGNMKAEGREDSSKMKAEGREDRNGGMKAEGREDGSKMKAEGREDRNGGMKAEGKSNTTIGQAGAGAKLSTEQRTKITTVIRDQHVAPVNNVNFSISIGTRVPRGVSFHPLPTEVVTVYPEWRGYEFFLVRDQIVVVDPRTLEIVAVLEA
jgi:hypothetical protein